VNDIANIAAYIMIDFVLFLNWCLMLRVVIVISIYGKKIRIDSMAIEPKRLRDNQFVRQSDFIF